MMSSSAFEDAARKAVEDMFKEIMLGEQGLSQHTHITPKPPLTIEGLNEAIEALKKRICVAAPATTVKEIVDKLQLDGFVIKQSNPKITIAEKDLLTWIIFESDAVPEGFVWAIDMSTMLQQAREKVSVNPPYKPNPLTESLLWEPRLSWGFRDMPPWYPPTIS